MHNFVENLDTMIFKQKINMETFEQTGNHNLFMMCKQVNDKAFQSILLYLLQKNVLMIGFW